MAKNLRQGDDINVQRVRTTRRFLPGRDTMRLSIYMNLKVSSRLILLL